MSLIFTEDFLYFASQIYFKSIIKYSAKGENFHDGGMTKMKRINNSVE